MRLHLYAHLAIYLGAMAIGLLPQSIAGAQIRFAEVLSHFPREQKNLRKWDVPVVADLDRDGYVDLVLNEHGFGIRICWNNKGEFAKPFDLIMGDMHGVTVGDFDQDGNLELAIARGGGAGEQAKNAKLFRVTADRQFTELPNFRVPLKYMRGRTVKFFDGDNDGDLDLLNFAFPSKEMNGASENYVYENDGHGQLTLAGTLPAIKKDGQKTLLTDINRDGVLDLLMYGDGRVSAYQGKSGLNFKEVTQAVFARDIESVTSIVEFDFDNDGDFDLYMTRGHDFEPGQTFYDPETQVWGFYTKRGAFQFDELLVGDILQLENYQAQWPNKKLLIGESAYEYEFPGETHSGRDIRIVNSDALGWPDEISEKAAHLGYVGNQRWRLAGNIWSPTTGIVRGVRSYQPSEQLPGLPDLLLENRGGLYVDVTRHANLFAEAHTTGVTVGDFNHDGWQDLAIVRRGDLVHPNECLVYVNRGDAGFERVANHGLISTELGAIGLGIEAFDYDRDGRIDLLLGNERGKWHLFKNEAQRADCGNSLTIALGPATVDAATYLGAVVTVTAGDRQHKRRIGATSAAYSLSHNPLVHIGLGSWNDAVNVKIEQTNGKVVQRQVAELNQVHAWEESP